MNDNLYSFFIFSILTLNLYAQNPVPVGSGSYAEYPPDNITGGTRDNIDWMLSRDLDVIRDQSPTRPIPTNDWWTEMILKEVDGEMYGGRLWAYPVMASAENYGMNISIQTGWGEFGSRAEAMTGSPVQVRGVNFAPESSVVRNWGDWTFDFLLPESGSKYMLVTLGHGIPTVWTECFGIDAEVTFGGANSIYDNNGNEISFPFTGDHFGVTVNGREWGIFAPPNTEFSGGTGGVTASFDGSNGYIVVSAMTQKSDLQTFYSYAYNVPRDSRVTWEYRPEAGELATLWEHTTENLRGEEPGGIIQGWIAHHWRTTSRDFEFNGMEYQSGRGTLKCGEGRLFEIVYPFSGILPRVPAPETLAGADNPYNETMLREIVNDYSYRSGYDVETYAGGIAVARYAQYLNFAHELGMTEAENRLLSTLRGAFEDWFTYTPGETEHYFCYYPNWKALVGIKTAFAAEKFIDHHFHYGYFIYAASILAMYDEEFADLYGEMAKTVAKEYANWNRSDTLLPYLRTLDIWVGHSMASGLGNSGGGSNQESSSESMNSWMGIYQLGLALDDPEIRDCGIFGYVTESQACAEYYFDRTRSVHPLEYTPPIATILWHNQFVYATYFSQAPVWKHAIEWLPLQPGSYYLTQDTVFAKWEYDTMMTEQRAVESIDWNGWGDGLGNYVLSYLGFADPDRAARVYDSLYDAGTGWVTGQGSNGITYYFTHANRNLGRVKWDWHMDTPSSQVFYNSSNDTWSFVAYNNEDTETEITVYEGRTPRYSFTAPAKTLIIRHLADVQEVKTEKQPPSLNGLNSFFHVKGSQSVKLAIPDKLNSAEILDIRGRLIRRIKTGPGKELSWDGKDRSNTEAACGTYILNLRGTNFTTSKLFTITE